MELGEELEQLERSNEMTHRLKREVGALTPKNPPLPPSGVE